MSTLYEKGKESIMKWRKNNIDGYRLYQKNYAKANYEEKTKEKKKIYYQLNKEKIMAQREHKKSVEEEINLLMNILFND